MSQPAHKSRTTQFIYRFDMNRTFDLADLYAPLQKGACPNCGRFR